MNVADIIFTVFKHMKQSELVRLCTVCRLFDTIIKKHFITKIYLTPHIKLPYFALISAFPALTSIDFQNQCVLLTEDISPFCYTKQLILHKFYQLYTLRLRSFINCLIYEINPNLIIKLYRIEYTNYAGVKAIKGKILCIPINAVSLPFIPQDFRTIYLLPSDTDYCMYDIYYPWKSSLIPSILKRIYVHPNLRAEHFRRFIAHCYSFIFDNVTFIFAYDKCPFSGACRSACDL